MAYTYEQVLQQQPLSTEQGDRSAARRFVDFLDRVIKYKEVPDLNDSQKTYLYKLRDRWEKRAQGKDERWNEMGSKPGPRRHTLIGESLRGRLDRTTFGEDDELDPLLASLKRNLGE